MLSRHNRFVVHVPVPALYGRWESNPRIRNLNLVLIVHVLPKYYSTLYLKGKVHGYARNRF